MKNTRIISVILVLTLMSSLFCVATNAVDATTSDCIPILIEAGYTKETAEALPIEDQQEIAKYIIEKPEDVDISSVSLEVDILSEIETFLSYSDEDLIDLDISLDSIIEERNRLLSYNSMKTSSLAKELNISYLEADMIKMAIEEGLKCNGNNEKKMGVSASGTIASSELNYTQGVTNLSSSSAPAYQVYITYAWRQVYALAALSDTIVAAWGGGLNTKDISSSAYYYHYQYIGGDFTTLYKRVDMSVTEQVQSGIKFTFSQCIADPSDDNIAPKTKTGMAKFTIYQTKFQGYDTKVLSNYCHKLLKPNASIGISASGPSVSISIGTGYDSTPQKASTIRY